MVGAILATACLVMVFYILAAIAVGLMSPLLGRADLFLIATIPLSRVAGHRCGGRAVRCWPCWWSAYEDLKPARDRAARNRAMNRAFGLLGLAVHGWCRRGPDDAALRAVEACRTRLDTRVDIGIDRLRQRCPELLPALQKAPVA